MKYYFNLNKRFSLLLVREKLRQLSVLCKSICEEGKPGQPW